MTTRKIATCCYCGTRAALVLAGDVRHELACSRCGAPLHDLKMLRADRPTAAKPRRPEPIRTADRKPRRKSALRRAGRWKSKLFEEAMDFLEDILD